MERTRSCDECIACCSYLEIEGLNKPAFSHCTHCLLAELEQDGVLQYNGSTDKNCKAYDTDKRLDICYSYKCMWLYGYGNEEDRPDKCMILFDNVNHITGALEAKALDDGVEDTPEGREVIERMSKSTGLPALVIGFYDRQIKRIVGRGL